MELSGKLIEEICKAAERIRGYGSVTIHFVENSPTVDIEINDRIRVNKGGNPLPGEVVRAQKIVVVRRDN
jgi:hypothetical protein